MYQEIYKIENTLNLDGHGCFHNENTYPNFQKKLKKFKSHIDELVKNKKPTTFYKFGDGDYRFLTKQSVGSASPGKRALSKSYNEINQHVRYENKICIIIDIDNVHAVNIIYLMPVPFAPREM